MGNYVFTADALVEALEQRRRQPRLATRHGRRHHPDASSDRDEAGVYDFKRNDVPGSTPHDRDYWRDVGTLASYHEAHLDLVSVEPTFNLYNTQWPIFTEHPQLPGAKFVEEADGRRRIVVRRLDRLGRDDAASVHRHNVYVSTGAAGRPQRDHGQRQDRRRGARRSTRSSTRTS